MAGRRVLLVEDDPAVAGGLAALLESEGICVLVVNNGGDALLEMASFRPDVVILDLTLPDMPGEVVYSYLRKGFPDLPIVISTGSVEEEQFPSGESVAFLRKPYDFDTLLQTLQKLIK